METKQIKDDLAHARDERQLMYLTAAELDRILHWTLRGQYHRTQRFREGNTDRLVRAVTGRAFAITDTDWEEELNQRLKILCELGGVGISVATAILALTYPEKYVVISFRGWRPCFGEMKQSFSFGDYRDYMREVRRLSRELGWPVQEVDHAIWEYDRQHD